MNRFQSKVFLLSIIMPTLCASVFKDAIEDQFITEQEPQVNKNVHLEGWQDDFSNALKNAKEQKKAVLVAFLGSSWCQWSDKLENEVLIDKNFLSSLEKEMLLVKVDVPEELLQDSQENRLKEKYQVQKCPSLILVDSLGSEIAKIETLSVKAQDYVANIKDRLNDYYVVCKSTENKHLKTLTLQELKVLYDKSSKLSNKTFRKVFLEEGLKKDKGSFFLLERYHELLDFGKNKPLSKLRKKILNRDPQNTEKTQLKLALLDFEFLSHVVKKPQKIDGTIQPLVEYLKHFGKQDKNAWKLEMMISQYLFGKNKNEDALKHAKASLEMAPKSEQKEIIESIEYLKTCIEN